MIELIEWNAWDKRRYMMRWWLVILRIWFHGVNCICGLASPTEKLQASCLTCEKCHTGLWSFQKKYIEIVDPVENSGEATEKVASVSVVSITAILQGRSISSVTWSAFWRPSSSKGIKRRPVRPEISANPGRSGKLGYTSLGSTGWPTPQVPQRALMQMGSHIFPQVPVFLSREYMTLGPRILRYKKPTVKMIPRSYVQHTNDWMTRLVKEW